MIDENAFGILVSYVTVEDDEYGLERGEFVRRFELFRDTMKGCLRDLPLGRGVRAVDLGHAHYVEVADGDHAESPLGWAKKVRVRLGDAGFETMVAVTHGGRWVDEAAEAFFSTEHAGDAALLTVSNPSEPFRRALHADTASRSDGEAGHDGWGTGLFLDVEAVEALGIKPKNAPTSLSAGGAAFYRVGG